MKLGTMLSFNQHTPIPFIEGAARIVEERFHSVWVPEHVLFFPEYASRYPYSDDGRVPGDPTGVMEPFAALTYLAAITRKIRLGTGVCLVPQRQPVYTAKQAADLDFLSGGRFDFGIGVGWLAEEFEALNVPFEERAPRTIECIELMRALWCDEVSQYEGKFYRLPSSYQNPKPVQKPHPPLFFGGESKPALRRVATLGDGWFGFNLTPEALAKKLVTLDALLADAGRSRSDITIYISPPGHRIVDGYVDAYAELGVDQIICAVGARDLSRLEERADRLRASCPA